MTTLRKALLPALLLRFWVGLLALTILSAAYTLTMTLHHHSPYPWGVQLLWRQDFGWDLLVFRDRFLHFRSPDFWQIPGIPLTYPATVGVVFGMLYKFAHPVVIYLGLCAMGGVAWAIWLGRRLVANGVAKAPAAIFVFTVAATCWPLWVLVDTANIEGLVAILLGAGILALVLRNRPWLGAVMIGIAGSMKLFPLILLGLLLAKKRYKEFTAGILVAALVTVASLAVLGPSIAEAQRQIDIGLALIQNLYFFTMKSDAAALDHSLWVAVRYAAVYADRLFHPASAARQAAILAVSLRAYFIATVTGGVTLYVKKIRNLPALNQVLALTICAVLLPPLSLEYTLVHLLLPFALLCAYAVAMEQRRTAVQGLGTCFVCFVVLFNIETFLSNRFVYAAEFRTLALVVLLILVSRFRFEWPELETRSEPT